MITRATVALLAATILPVVPAFAQDGEVAAPAAPAPERPVGSSEVSVSEFMTVDIVAHNTFVTDVLQKLAIQARRNIVPSGATERLVTANIYGAPFYEALEALLAPNGLGFVERGDFILVYTLDELATLEVGGFGATSKLIRLDYLRAEDARNFVTAMISSNGSIEVTQDLVEDGGGEEAVEEAGSSALKDTDFYSPEKDEFALDNAIIVHDLPERVERIEAFLRSIDTRPKQILLEASIVQTSLTEQTALGVDFAMLGDFNFTSFFDAPIGGQALDFGTVTDANGLEQPVGLPAGDAFVQSTGGNVGAGDATVRAGYVDNVGVFLRALDSVTDVTLLSNPKVMTLNRQRAKVFVGTKVGFFETSQQLGQTILTFKTIDVGILLDMRPYILQDGRIRLELSPKVSDVDFRSVAVGGFVQDVPDENIQTVTTDILIPEGHTAVIGGLFREDTSRSTNQIPILGSIPFIGSLFGGRDDRFDQLEIIFMIKPTILDDASLGAIGDAGMAVRDDVHVGNRTSLLLWARERQSARLNLEADQLLGRGQTTAARWNLRRSLGMFPNQPDVVRSLERLDGRDGWMRNSSLVSRSVDDEFALLRTGAGDDGVPD